MVSEFFGEDLSDSVYWGVDLRRALFRDADLSGARFFHTLWSDASIDGIIDRLVVNGVDVTAYVNSHDRWYPLRTHLEPATASDLRKVWVSLQKEWSALLSHVSELPAEEASRSVNGEWSALDTLRHLIFAIEKWFFLPVLHEQEFSPIGLPNSGSVDFPWPGLTLEADPSWDEVLDVRNERIKIFTDYIEALEFDSLPESVEVLENGSVPTITCFHAVLEEEFEHLRYVIRDLDIA